MRELPEAVQRLVDRQDIADVLLRYARGIDRRDPELLRSCYHPDAVDAHGQVSGAVDEFIDSAMSVLGNMGLTNHILCNMWIEVDGDVAVGETYFIALHRLHATDQDAERDFFLAGRYIDRFERRAGSWKIAHRRIMFDHMRVDPATDCWGEPVGPLSGLSDRGEPNSTDFVYARWKELRTAR